MYGRLAAWGKTDAADPLDMVVVLDELTYMVAYDYLPLEEASAAPNARPVNRR